MALPRYPSIDKTFTIMQSRWAQQLDPIIQLPMNAQNTLIGVSLIIGDTTINHGLGRPLQGWFLVRQRAAASIYDKQDANGSSDITLVLTSDAVVTVDIVVF